MSIARSLDVRRAYASHASPPRPAPHSLLGPSPPEHVAETRYRDSSRPPVRNRSPGGWGYGVRESRARPSFPVSIRYTRDDVAIQVNLHDTHFKASFSVKYPYSVSITILHHILSTRYFVFYRVIQFAGKENIILYSS